MWIKKLESMNEILLSEQLADTKEKDPFEDKFKILRDKQ